jgi:chlorophyllide a reductase subunit Z
MGYSGATWLVQEVANALFDALFHILPLATAMDKVAATPSRLAGASTELDWDDDARAALETLVEAQPVLVRISAAKRLRDAAEGVAQERGESRVTTDHIEHSAKAFAGAPA